MQYVCHRLHELLNSIPIAHPIFGPLEDESLRMPKFCATDKRKLTWAKLIDNLASLVQNDPKDDITCWFVPANKADGTHTCKLSKDGSRNKWLTSRILKVLQDPSCYALVNSRSKLHLMHRCHLGKAMTMGGLTCINPFHLIWGDSQLNQDQKGCVYGARFLCPHSPPCLFNWHDTGRSKLCFNQLDIPSSCPHSPRCSHTQRHSRT